MEFSFAIQLKFIQDVRIFFLGHLGAWLLRVLNRTLRWKRIGFDGTERYWASDSPKRIITFWHAHQLMMTWIQLGSRRDRQAKPITGLISEHSDGRLIAKVVECLGAASVAGSSSHGGREAIYALIAKLRDGFPIAITPDGPKGPPEIAKAGVLKIAQKTGALIYPAAIGAKRKWVFNSWDKMFLPKPFSKAVIIMGEPIQVEARMNPAQLGTCLANLESQLMLVTRQARDYFNPQSTFPRFQSLPV